MLTKIGQDLKAELITVTPELAHSWLSKNTKNRKVSRATVTAYANDMALGNWQTTGDAVRFSTDGDLLDGQHRLMACIEAGRPFETVVIYGVPGSAQDVMDSGKTRSVSDVLSLHDYKNTSVLAAMTRIMISEGLEIHLNFRMTMSLAQEVLDQHPQMHQYAISPGTFPRGVSIANGSAIYYIASVLRKDRESGAAFIHTLKTGIPTGDGCPVHGLRERLMRQLTSKETLSRSVTWNAFKGAYNAFIDGRKITRYTMPHGDVAIHGVKPHQYFSVRKARNKADA